MNKKITAVVTGIVTMLAFTAFPAFAHVIVYPHQVGIAATQEFSMAVPAEKPDNPVVGIKLLIPDGLLMVVPNAKAGWTITTKVSGTGDSATVTEIDWTGGSIQPDQRDDFLFQAQVPAKETILQWKAYQTYSDGSVVAWINPPSKNPMDDSAPPPYSTTRVVNDLTGNQQPNGMTGNAKTMINGIEVSNTLPLILSVIALLAAGASLWMQLQKKQVK
jgi:uncharacterized protein YcnI